MRMNRYNLQLVYCDEKGEYVQQGKYTAEEMAEESADINARYNHRALQTMATIHATRVEKPGWFKHQERLARQFIYQELGLVAAKGTQITVVDSDSSPEAHKQLFGNMDVPGKIYYHGYHHSSEGIVIRNSILDMAQQQQNPTAIGKLLVHELTHAATPVSQRSYHRYDHASDSWSGAFRQGVMTEKPDGSPRGGFFNEGLAEFCAGFYVRRLNDPTCSLVDDGPMRAELPLHYRSHNVDTGVPLNEGPDAYALELIARTVGRKGELSPDEYMQRLLGVYSVHEATRLSGYRALAHGVNQVQPGLYRQLRDLPAGATNWQTGLDMVLDALSIERTS